MKGKKRTHINTSDLLIETRLSSVIPLFLDCRQPLPWDYFRIARDPGGTGSRNRGSLPLCRPHYSRGPLFNRECLPDCLQFAIKRLWNIRGNNQRFYASFRRSLVVTISH
jgi:hypothetical protein